MKGPEMKMNSSLRALALCTACLSLSACFGSSNNAAPAAGGGAGAGAGAPASASARMSAFDTNMTRVQGMTPTLTPITGTSNYAGSAKLQTFDDKSNVNGFVVADLNMRLNFDAQTLSGTATNIAGEIDGAERTLAGTLDSANSNSPNLIASSQTQAPVIGTITSTSILANMRGDLTDSVSNETATFELGLQGPMFGTDGAASYGAAVALVGDPTKVGFGFGGAGQYYIEKQ